jgi:hypothetical protein
MTFRPMSLSLSRGEQYLAGPGERRLAYSSTFAGEQTGSQGFTGAPGGGGGSTLGNVYQRIDMAG